MTLQRKLLSCGAILAGVLSTACPRNADPNWITPTPGRVQATTFKVGNNVLVPQVNNSKFEVDQPISITSGTVNARVATEVQLTVLASNPVTGVKSLDVTVTDPSGQYSTATHVDGVPNSSGQVPTSLLSIGTHPGFPDDKPLKLFVTLPGGKLVAKAVSFDGTQSSIVLDYVPWGEPYAEFQISPSQIKTGGETEMVWNSSFATLEIDNGIGPVAPMDHRKIKPASTTTYHLTASNPFDAIQKEATVKVGVGGNLTISYKNPQAPPGNVPSNATFTYTGTLSSAPVAGNQGAVSFNQSVMATFSAGQAWNITHQVNDLATGTWLITVSAGSPQSGPYGTLACSVTVPGSTTATQGALPNCS